MSWGENRQDVYEIPRKTAAVGGAILTLVGALIASFTPQIQINQKPGKGLRYDAAITDSGDTGGKFDPEAYDEYLRNRASGSANNDIEEQKIPKVDDGTPQLEGPQSNDGNGGSSYVEPEIPLP